MVFNQSVFEKFNQSVAGATMTGSFYQDNPSVLTIILNGYLDTGNSQDFFGAVVAALDSYTGVKKLVFDLRKLTYIASTGIGAFTNLLIYTKRKNADLFLLNLGEKVRTVLKSLGLTGSFNLIGTVEECLNGQSSGNGFPLNLNCPSCKKLLRIKKPGAARCPACQTIFKINPNGKLGDK